jgi:hypothetical protein
LPILDQQFEHDRDLIGGEPDRSQFSQLIGDSFARVSGDHAGDLQRGEWGSDPPGP